MRDEDGSVVVQHSRGAVRVDDKTGCRFCEGYARDGVADEAVSEVERSEDRQVVSVENCQPGCASREHRAVALNPRGLGAAIRARGADGEEVFDNWGGEAIDSGYRVVPTIFGSVPQPYATVSGDHDVVPVLEEITHGVAGKAGNQTSVPPRACVGVEGLEACCRTLAAHQADIHRTVVLEHHPVHLGV